MIPLQWPMSNDKLNLTVWDYDSGSSDELVGSIMLSLKEIVDNCSNESGELRWVNIYGAHTGYIQFENMIKMNNNPEVASLWKGRVLLHIKVQNSTTVYKS